MQHVSHHNGNSGDDNSAYQTNGSLPGVSDQKTDLKQQSDIASALEDRLDFKRFISVRKNQIYTFYRKKHPEDTDFQNAIAKLSDEAAGRLAEKLINRCLKDPHRFDTRYDWMAGELYVLTLKSELSSPVLSKKFSDAIKHRFISNLDNNKQNLDGLRELLMLDIFLPDEYLFSDKVLAHITKFICKELEQRPVIAFSLLNSQPLGRLREFLISDDKVRESAEKAVINLLEYDPDNKILTLRLEKLYDYRKHSIPGVINGLIQNFSLEELMKSEEYTSAVFRYFKKTVAWNDLTEMNHSLSLLARNPDCITEFSDDSKVILKSLKPDILSSIYFEFKDGMLEPGDILVFTQTVRNFMSLSERKDKNFLRPLRETVINHCKSNDPAVTCFSLASLIRLVPPSRRENFISGKIWNAVSRRFDNELENLTEYLEDVPGLSDNSAYAVDSEIDYDKYCEKELALDAGRVKLVYQRFLSAAKLFGFETWNVPPFPEPLNHIAEIYTPVTESLGYASYSGGSRQDYKTMSSACWRDSLNKAKVLYSKGLKNYAALLCDRAYKNIMRLNLPELEKRNIADLMSLRAVVCRDKNTAPVLFNQALVFHIQVLGRQNLSLSNLLTAYADFLLNSGKEQASRACLTLAQAINNSFFEEDGRMIKFRNGTQEFYDMQIAFEEFESELVGIPNPIFMDLISPLPKYIDQH